MGKIGRAWVVVAVALATLVAGCTSSGSGKSTGTTLALTNPTLVRPTVAATVPATTTTNNSLTRTAMAAAGGLTINLVVMPARAKARTTISFRLSAHEGEAHGALEYQIFYGDGTSDQNPAPQYCVTTPSVADQSWSLSHSYATPGTYMAFLTATATCTRDRAVTQHIAITIS